MKNLLTLLLLVISCSAFSQDIITLADGRTVKAKILEISPETIRYKKFDNQDGPTFAVPITEITKVRYANGSEDTFNTEPVKSTTPAVKGSSTLQIFQGKLNLDDPETEKYIEAIAKVAGAILLERCISGTADNTTTEIFWGEIIRDDNALELSIPIQIKWEKGLMNTEYWIRGTITVDRNGKRTWSYQSCSAGPMLGNCARGIIEL